MADKPMVRQYKQQTIRSLWDEAQKKGYFSIVDVAGLPDADRAE